MRSGPFAIDLPRPPSKNRLNGFGKGRVYRTYAYKKWLADACALSAAARRGRAPIATAFDVKIFYSEHRIGKGDPQNIIDPLLDWAQHAGIVSNDKNLRSLKLEPGDIGNDCRLVIEELPRPLVDLPFLPPPLDEEAA